MVDSVGPHDQLTCVRGDSFVVSGPRGDVVSGGDHGFYVRDTRILNHLEVLIDGEPPHPLSGIVTSSATATFHAYLAPSSDHEVDPTLLVLRRRSVAGGLHEEVELQNAASTPATHVVTVGVATDFAYIFDVKHGRQLPSIPPVGSGSPLRFERPDGVEATTLSVTGADVDPAVQTIGDLTWLRWELTVPARSSRRLCFDVSATDPFGTVEPERRCETFTGLSWEPAPQHDGLSIGCPDRRFSRLVRRSALDLESLTQRDPSAPDDRFAAAGSPWFLTLFGRDSIWAAMMALPLDLDLARGTLWTLARRQGERVVEDTEEAPGKILHEVRRGALVDRGDLPPFYYGSIDATPLFIVLAHEAWRWGLPDDEVEALMPSVEAALGWLRDHGDADGSGFISYVRHGDRGLTNQGWKDSGDGIRFADGTVAQAPLALSEVQGYAYAAAVRGAELLERFHRPGADSWRRWAADLADRFRQAYWVEDERGTYPAVALDHEHRPVDSVASNMGHLLFTGILSDEEAARVAGRLAAPDMTSGWGLRTLSSESGGFNPLSYHCGTVWPHDTVITAWGLARTGHDAAATELILGLVRAAPTFRYRLPELFAGLPRVPGSRPVPYPTACRPQAWAAAGALMLVRATLGADVDVPRGQIRLRPLRPGPFPDLSVSGLQVAGAPLSVHLRPDGEVVVGDHPLKVVVE